MNKKISKRYVDWQEYLLLVDALYNKIDWEKESFKSIIAVNRGGNIVGTMLSHKANIPLTVLNKTGMIYETEKFLVVDDIADSGSTLQHIDYMSQGVNFKNNPLCASNKDFKTATLHFRKESKVVPNYFVETVDKWIVYPYERA